MNFISINLWRLFGFLYFGFWLVVLALMTSSVAWFGVVLLVGGLICVFTAVSRRKRLLVSCAGVLVLAWSILPPPRPKTYRY